MTGSYEDFTPSVTFVQETMERGYKEALLDVYLFLTGDERITQYPERMALIENMITQVNSKSNRLAEVG